MRHNAVIFTPRTRILYTIISLGILGSSLLPAKTASADIFTTGNPGWHGFYVSADNLTVRPGEIVSFNNSPLMGGDLQGVLNGEALYATYCVNLTNHINLNATYDNTVITYDGSVYGEPINNAEGISWLLTNYAFNTLTVDEQNGLQAAIWRTEYGSNFQIDGVDNANSGNTIAMMTAYQTYLAALGTNTTPTSSVLWISADNVSPIVPHAQGLVAVRGVPEPGSIAFVLAGGLPLIGLIARRRRAS